MSDYFLCCFYYNRQSDSRHNSSAKFPLRHIDKSMIGLPTNFQHCAHIGCSDLATTTSLPTTSPSNLIHRGNSANESPNQSKEMINYQYHQQPVLTHMKLIDLKIS